MELVTEVRMESAQLVDGLEVRVHLDIGSPVQCAGEHIVAATGASLVRVIVSARFGNVDFPGSWPGAVHVVHWKHPDRRPKPISLRHLGSNFDSAILDRCALLCVDARGPDRRQQRAVRDIVVGKAADEASPGAVAPKIDGRIISAHKSLILQLGTNVQYSVFDE